MNILILLAISYVTTYQRGGLSSIPKYLITLVSESDLLETKIKLPIPVEDSFELVSFTIGNILKELINCNFCWNFWLSLPFFVISYGYVGFGISVLYSVIFNKTVQTLGLHEI